MKTILISLLILLGFLVSGQHLHKDELSGLIQVDEGEPGAMLVIIENDLVVFEDVKGLASLEHNVKLSSKTVMDIGTMAMHFTAACILKLEQEGKLSLDDEVRQHLPLLPMYKEGVITIRHLLHHNSGLRDYIALLIASGQSFQGSHDQESTLAMIYRQQGLTIEPGTEYRFSQSNYVLLAEIVETVAQMEYSKYLKKHFLEPYGMKSTYIYTDASQLMKNRAQGYHREGEKWSLDQRYNFTTYGEGRIYSSLEDLTKWTINIQKSDLYRKLVKRGTLNDGSQMTYARGLEYGTMNGAKMFAHNGYFGAFSAMYMHFTGENKTVLALANRTDFSAPSITYDAADIIIDNKISEAGEITPEEVADVSLNNEQLQNFSGAYFYEHYGYLRKLEVVNDTLTYTIDDEVTRKLIPISENSFVAEGLPFRTVWKFEKSRMLVLSEGEVLYEYVKVAGAKPSTSKLEDLTGTYESAELGVAYELLERDGNLVTMMNSEEIATFQHVDRTIFTSAHDGYIEVEDDCFYLNDYSLGRIKFKKKG